MNESFERDLHAALKRHQPPPDFAERVLAQLPAPRVVPRRKPRAVFQFGAIAAAVALLAISAYQYQQYRRGLAAKQQLMFALELTSQKLHVAHDKVNQRNQQP